jgi:hypothetical protein
LARTRRPDGRLPVPLAEIETAWNDTDGDPRIVIMPGAR